ncbi:monovalent cation:proton antiporter-2 (CPA2) family protein [Nitratireductor sp. ZSWI3]|uniref:monovalent cation:proton antiporter-2 (CPA2) family protein n=1 Tax=Nitratireductor sp. ZSWI3 TaxID=2966359 RepID=UPI00215010DF|nr:monovalent cation:proton antiporter-2 (CPA2) family protein [Nitratireductor sp. ZSWI3]MCR4269027.1 monovalent cation:proton antiporter-2 (CPA2) family protein [Nitratireductor sp. ZSWI3]
MAVEAAPLYYEPLLLLAGAVIAAPLFKRVGLGTILGYLAAGIAIGPVARLIVDGRELLHVAELGVVFLLFIIGLELKPARLWAMRRSIFGLGLVQVVVTGTVLAAIGVAFLGFSFGAAFIVGFGLALSSTAFSVQTLEEQGTLNHRYGQTSFSILLFQDLAIAPLLALIPLLSPGGEGAEAISLERFALALASVAALVAAGRYLLNPLFRIIANTGAKEVMIAAALLVVLGSASLMEMAGLSMALGAFIAGVLLAESSFRHELEADIEPFRGILLGLFFMAIGLSLDLGIIFQNWLAILIAVPVLMLVKAVILYGIGRVFGCNHNDALRVAALLPQGGEFGFVLFTAAASAFIFSSSMASLLIAIVTVSMAVTPLSVRLGELLARSEQEEEMDEDFDGAGADVMLIGFSRFGQIVSQVLLSGGTEVTIIDHSADRVRAAGRFGFRIYFGDGRRKEVLEAAGIRRAKLVAVCTNGVTTTDRIVNLIRDEFPHVRLYVRSYDRAHTLSLRDRDVEYEIRETSESALMFGRSALEAVGIDEEMAREIMEDVRRRDEERLAIQAVEGIYAGNDKMRVRPVTPEPLIKPTREARRLDPEGREKPLEDVLEN